MQKILGLTEREPVPLARAADVLVAQRGVLAFVGTSTGPIHVGDLPAGVLRAVLQGTPSATSLKMPMLLVALCIWTFGHSQRSMT